MKGASKFWLGMGMLLVLAGAAVWAEMQHRPKAGSTAAPAPAPTTEAQPAPAAPQSTPPPSNGPVGGGDG